MDTPAIHVLAEGFDNAEDAAHTALTRSTVDYSKGHLPMFRISTIRLVTSLFLFAIAAMSCSKSQDAASVGPPEGTTGNEWTAADFAGSDSRLAREGGPEFVNHCKAAGSCKLEGDVLAKLQDILAKYPVADAQEYDHFSVVVRDGLIDNGLLPEGDPERYQYQLTMLASTLAAQ